MLTAIIAIIGGIIAASPLIISKKPNAKELIDKLTPFQGIIGIVLLVWGVLGLLNSISLLGTEGVGMTYVIIAFAVAGAEIVVGFMLGYGLLSKYLLEKNETAKAKGAEMRVKLAKFQVPAGVLLIVLGVLSIVL